ncbi:hypothetical protein EUGRSUZ_I01678 [Eucalyptus grandis]|uniref:Uncharacterized protein n=2 Tax=Eucalyptus grandis TaxID=71139 RepID=A0ACC3JES6_EUCGR|nr:hypothetical protein EUGRSUZ_I01678 [Eucalyptus grandis]
MSTYTNLVKDSHPLIRNFSNDSNTPSMSISFSFRQSSTKTSFSFVMLDSMSLSRGPQLSRQSVVKLGS